MFWLLEETGSAALMSTVLFVVALPGVLVGPLAGAIVDRHSRKHILVYTDLVRGFAVAVPALLILSRVPNTYVIAAFVVVAAANGLAAALFNPAIAAGLPDITSPGRLTSANSLQQLSAQVAISLGQAAGGVAFRVLGAPLLFLIDSVSFVISAASEGSFTSRNAST